MRRLFLPLLAFLSIAAAGPAEEAQSLLDQGRQREAFELVERGAAVGDLGAIDMLASFYEEGEVVARDLRRAASLYRRAADRGFAPSQWRLGVLLDLGQGVEADPAEAVRWFGRAAAQGNTNAITSLAVMHATGRGVPLNYPEAMRLYREAARLGNAHGFYGVGVMYAHGQSVAQDPLEAFAWLAVAASLGNADAERALNQVGLPPERVERAVGRANEIIREMRVDMPPIRFEDRSGEGKGARDEDERPLPTV
jgi:TPR repeat protein